MSSEARPVYAATVRRIPKPPSSPPNPSATRTTATPPRSRSPRMSAPPSPSTPASTPSSPAQCNSTFKATSTPPRSHSSSTLPSPKIMPERADRCGFKETVIKSEFLGLVYQAIGNIDVRVHFDDGAGAGVTRKAFFDNFLAKKPTMEVVRFFRSFLPPAQSHYRVFETSLIPVLDPTGFEKRNKTVHDITFSDMYDLITTLRFSDRHREAAVYETLCAAVTSTAFAEEWRTNTTSVSSAAAEARKVELVSLDDVDDAVASQEEKKNRRVAIQLRIATKRFEETRKVAAVIVWEEALMKKGWIKTDRISVNSLENQIAGIQKQLHTINVIHVSALVLATVFFVYRSYHVQLHLNSSSIHHNSVHVFSPSGCVRKFVEEHGLRCREYWFKLNPECEAVEIDRPSPTRVHG
ncbi:hypothetical protein B0H17DRAFT_1132818 [Mycena rosella]|uniref:Uncharacterized protein n=1 Tax=Mycena rosella TaxID=1033263 RepID=A0AAD7DM74_MYCRO|nr:hypothetical protein B0H17DRAFT_1132818 [Mycena rosella]